MTEAQRAELLANYEANGSVRGVDIELRRHDGEVLHVLYAIEAIEMQGEPCFLVLVVDIGLRKRMELQLRQLNGELEARVAQRTADLQAALGELQTALADVQRAAKMKDQFMAMVSHELRTPLMGVLSLAEVLGTQRVGALNEKQLGYVRSIERSGQRLHALVNSILSYVDLLAGNVQLQIAPYPVSDLLRAAAAAIRPQAEAKGQAVAVEGVEGGPPPHARTEEQAEGTAEEQGTAQPEALAIETDGGALRQVLDRLLANAVKFTPEGGQVGVEAQLCAGGEHVQIAVWDTGIGMERAQLDEAVKPFTQVGATLTRSHDGVGLGLAYAHQMLILLHGQLTLESAPEQGSRFVITLPRRWT
jgi:signal transduction histidine kinase